VEFDLIDGRSFLVEHPPRNKSQTPPTFTSNHTTFTIFTTTHAIQPIQFAPFTAPKENQLPKSLVKVYTFRNPRFTFFLDRQFADFTNYPNNFFPRWRGRITGTNHRPPAHFSGARTAIPTQISRSGVNGRDGPLPFFVNVGLCT
jgi:hypothetical protein